MHIAAPTPAASGQNAPARETIATEAGAPVGTGIDPRFAQYKVIRRNGSVVGFEPTKITIAMTKAFLAIHGGQGAASARVRDEVTKLTDLVVVRADEAQARGRRDPHRGDPGPGRAVADARRRARGRARLRPLPRAALAGARARRSTRRRRTRQSRSRCSRTASRKPLDLARLTRSCANRAPGLADVDAERILKATLKDLYDGVPIDEVRKCVVLAARTLIEKDPHYSYVTARLLLDALRFEALGEEATQADMAAKYPEYFPQFVKHGVKIGLLNEALLQYDMASSARR